MIAWAAVAFALAGSWLVGSRWREQQRIGWVGFLVSNALWIARAVELREWPLLVMQCAFVATSIRGLWTSAR